MSLAAKIKKSNVREFAVPGWEIEGKQVVVKFKPIQSLDVLSSDIMDVNELERVQKRLQKQGKNADPKDLRTVIKGMEHLVRVALVDPKICSVEDEERGTCPEDQCSVTDLGKHLGPIFLKIAQESDIDAETVDKASRFLK